MLSAKKKQIGKYEWDRINMRNVNHLLGVEFMHNLYNRHSPRINSIRFRNTITIWKDNVVNSFAPKSEWDMMSDWLGEKFFLLDKILVQQVKELIMSDRRFLFEFIDNFKKTNLKKISNTRLALCLLDLQEFVLGEIYVVNLVQIEYALTHAICRILERHEKDASKRARLLADLIISKDLTEFQKEEVNLGIIIKKGKKKNIFEPTGNKEIYNLLVTHCERYAYMYCAYGESPLTIVCYMERYRDLILKNDYISILAEIKKKYKKSREKLKSLNDKKLNELIPLMSELGVFRDKNKALLGQTVKYRMQIFNEIVRRGLEERGMLNYYLLSEILDLLRLGKKIDKKIINKRKKKGVKLIRVENLDYLQGDMRFTEVENAKSEFNGICASPGVVNGAVKIVITKKDAKKINKGDIMVAIGTDFDLMPAMQISSGVITEEGGLLSHASVVCRELKKPCCIGVKNATNFLKDEQVIRLDATSGKVVII